MNRDAAVEEQIARVQKKLARLKSEDGEFEIFGSEGHRYVLNPPLSLDKIEEFERNYKIKLPPEYSLFLQKLGNGGAGLFYGLSSLENSIYADMDYRREDNKLNPSAPFPLTEILRIDFDRYEEFQNDEYFQEKYWSPANDNGLLRMSNFGCGIFINLIVNGQEYGFMWTDDRGNDGGIYPSIELGNEEKLSFLDWYELWLDKSFEELESAEK